MPCVRPVASGQWPVARDTVRGARENRHWADEEYDARVMRCVTDDARSCARWKTALRGIGVVALGAVLVVLVMSW